MFLDTGSWYFGFTQTCRLLCAELPLWMMKRKIDVPTAGVGKYLQQAQICKIERRTM